MSGATRRWPAERVDGRQPARNRANTAARRTCHVIASHRQSLAMVASPVRTVSGDGTGTPRHAAPDARTFIHASFVWVDDLLAIQAYAAGSAELVSAREVLGKRVSHGFEAAADLPLNTNLLQRVGGHNTPRKPHAPDEALGNEKGNDRAFAALLVIVGLRIRVPAPNGIGARSCEPSST
jgi:hypothetical protein